MATEKQISERYGKTHTFQKQRLLGNVDLRKLGEKESVVMGDGKTYYWLLTERQISNK